MTFRLGAKHLALALSLGITTLGMPAFTVAQDATPVASPAGAPAMELPPPPAWAEVMATGLANPRGIAIGGDGAIYVAEAGVGGEGPCAMGPEGNEECFGPSGAVTRIANGSTERVLEGLASRAAAGGMNATGPNDVALAADEVYVLMGYGGDPASRVELGAGDDQFGFLLMAADGEAVPVVDVAGYETENNPDQMALDANPFALQMNADSTGFIVDAGMNALLQLGEDGALSTLAVFPNTDATAPDGSELPMNAVPTGLAVALDGAALVGQLTGFPFPPGGASISMVPASGGEPIAIQEGFTNIIDVALGPEGNLYVLEFNRDGILSIDPTNPATLEGQLTRIAPDGEREVIASEGLVAPTGLAVDTDGTIYVAVYGVVGDMGQIWKIAPAA